MLKMLSLFLLCLFFQAEGGIRYGTVTGVQTCALPISGGGRRADPMIPESSALLTDLYQLTMLQAYREQGMEQPAVFEFFVRTLPPDRGFLMAAGLEQLLEYVETLRFTPEA